MIAWVSFQRRADVMKEFWEYSDYYITTKFRHKLLKPLDYLIKIIKTINILAFEKPDVVWMQLPPTFMVFVGIAYKRLRRNSVFLIGDFHNSALRPKWFNFPFVRSALNRIDILVAHNEQVKTELIYKGINKRNVFVLEDMPFSYSTGNSEPVKNTILFPCSFDVDEPLDVVLCAAKELPHITFNITGNHNGKISPDVIKLAPDNVIFTGYLTKKAYDDLFLSSSVILGLTTRDNVQLSVSNEALSADKPMVLSDTTTLRNLFGDAAIFVESLDAKSISMGCVYAVEHTQELHVKTKILKSERKNRWKYQAEKIKRKITDFNAI